MVLASIGLLYLLLNEFRVPKCLNEYTNKITKNYLGLIINYDNFVVNIPSNKINVSSFTISVAEKKPFLSIGSTTIELASSTKIIGIIPQNTEINKITINDFKYDMLAPQLEEASGSFKLPSIPANEIYLNGFTINSPYGYFDLSDNSATLKKNNNVIDILLDIPKGPFGISAYFNSIIDLDTGSSTIGLKLKHSSLGQCLPITVYASEYNILVDDGSFNLNLTYKGNIEKRINEPLKDIVKLLNEEIQGEIIINNTKFSWNGIKFDGSLLATKLATQSWDFGINGYIASGSIDVKAKWLGKEDKLTDFSADFNASNISFSKEKLGLFGMPELDYKPGNLALSGHIEGNVASFSANGNAKANNWVFYNKKLGKSSVDWSLTEDFTINAKGFFDTDLGNLQASSTIWLSGDKKNKCVLDGNLKNINLKEIGNLVNVPLDGLCNGPFVIETDFQNPLQTIYSLYLSMNEGTIYTFDTKHIETTISGTGADWKVTNPHALLKDGGEVKVDGYIASTTLDAKVNIKNANLLSFGVPQDIASGTAQLDATVNGSIFKPNVKGTLWGNNLIVKDMPLKSFKSELHIKDAVLTLAPIVVKPIDGSIVDGYFTIDFKDAKIQNARVNFQQFCLELLRPYLPLKIASNEIDGVFSGYITYSRRNGDIYINALLDGRDLLLAGQEIESVYLEAESFKNQAELKNLFVRGFGGKLSLTGQIKNAQKFAGSLEGTNLKLNRIEFLKELLPDIEGSVDLQGDIDWDGTHRRGNFTVFGNDIKTNDRELGNYGGEIIIDDEKLEIKNGEFDKLGIKLSGDLMWGARQPYNFKLDLDKVDFSFIPQSHDLTIFENGSILVDGSCLVRGDLASLTPDLVDLKIDDIRIQKDNNVIVTNKPMRILYQNQNIEIRSLELKYKLGILAVEGVVSPDKKIAVTINGDNFSAKALGHMFGLTKLNYDGDIFLDARVYGTTDNIKYSSKVEVKNFNIEDRQIPEIHAKIDGDSSLLKVEETFVKLKNSSFNLNGDVNLTNFIPNNLNLKLSIPQSTIKDLSEYMPNLFKVAEGTVVGELNLTGNPTNPEITGDLLLNGSKIQLTSMKKPFTNVIFDMTTDDMITNVNTLKASMGKGLIEGYGKVDFKNSLGGLDVHLKAENLDLPFMSLEINNASASIDVTGDVYNPDFLGNIYIPRGKLGLNTSLIPESSKSKPIFNSLKYKVNIEIPRNFWVKNAFLNAEMKGKCSLSGDLNNFKLEGGISTIQGKIFFKQRQFKIQNGEIKFGGVDNSLDPYIFVKSEGQVQSTKIYLTLQGNISNFKPQVYSTPPMSEGDIIALLTLGRDLNSVSNSNTKDLFEDEVLEGLKNSYISALIGNSLSNALNVDELYLTSAFDKTTGKTQSYVRIGKYLSDKIFMAYEGTMSDDKDESYIFEYRLPKGFVFSIEFEQPEKNQNYGIRYDWKF